MLQDILCKENLVDSVISAEDMNTTVGQLHLKDAHVEGFSGLSCWRSENKEWLLVLCLLLNLYIAVTTSASFSRLTRLKFNSVPFSQTRTVRMASGRWTQLFRPLAID